MGPGLHPPPPDQRGHPIRCPLCYLIVNGPEQYNRHCCKKGKHVRWELKRKKRWKFDDAIIHHAKPTNPATGQRLPDRAGLERGSRLHRQLHHRRCWSCGWAPAPYECKECHQAYCGWHATICFWCDEYVCEQHTPPRAHHCRCLPSRTA